MGLSERGVKEEEISKPSKRGGSERCPGLALRGAGSAPAWVRPTPLRSAPPASAATARLEQPGCSGGG